MVLEERKCPNCGANEVVEKDGTYVCMNCRTFFDNPNDIKITKINITRNETELEKMKMRDKDTKAIYIILAIPIIAIFLLVIILRFS